MTLLRTAPLSRPRSRSRYILGLAPLLLAVAVSNACAAELIIVGPNGADGASGTSPGQAGGAGAAAADVVRALGGADAHNTLTLVGGTGGAGGIGADETEVEGEWGPQIVPRGLPGSAGSGGNAFGTVTTLSAAQAVSARSRVVGGDAGQVPYYYFSPMTDPDVVAAAGGSASSTVSAIATGAGSVVAESEAVGGRGGFDFLARKIGDDGTATAQAYGQSGTGNVAVSARAISGGHADVVLANAVSGRTSGELSLSQRAESAGNGARDAGSALSTLVLSDAGASRLSADVAAVGGSPSSYGFGGATAAGGAARSELTLTSTRAGAAVEGKVSAVGGDGYGYFSTAGEAAAIGRLSGTADVTGSASAIGGNGAAGNASAELTLSAGGVARGTVSARGGNLSYIMGSTNGTAAASLTMSGAGARGSAYAEGNGADSTVNVRTSGALAVDVVATAQIAEVHRSGGGIATATTDVRTMPGGGTAAVSAAAHADGGSGTGTGNAYVSVASAGDIVAIARAKGGYPSMCCSNSSGDANSSARAETSGNHAVSVSAISVANIGGLTGVPADFGSGSASAYGRSGSGAVNAVADVRGGSYSGNATANASAVTTERGGVATARATAVTRDVSATASAAAIGRAGTSLRFTASAAGAGAGWATAYGSSQFSQSDFALPGAGGTEVAAHVMAHVMAAPETAGALTLSPAASGIENVVGAGMQAMNNSDSANEWNPVLPSQQTTGQIEFATTAAQHLQVAFLSGMGGGFDLLELTISNHGVQLFSRVFLSGEAADSFFNGSLLDLGPLGIGMQDLLISSTLNYAVPGGYAFNYLIGTSAGATAVPEASTWLMMIVGMGGMLLVARRRAGPAARA